MSRFIRTLAEITAADRQRVGSKAYNCAQLRAAGFPVPDGIVVPVDATDADLRALPEHPWMVAQAPEALFAIRSSGIDEDGAGHSFAGIHDTHLNVPRGDVVDAVLRCRCSGQSAQAAAYRNEHQLSDRGVIAVLVQQMVRATASGVAFTINPVSGADEVVINIGEGLGEALVSGQIDPDEFVVNKRDLSIRSSRCGAATTTPLLAPLLIRELAAILVRIETHYGSAQDVEFCYDGTQFWIVQSRPITSTAGIPTRSNSRPDTSTRYPTPGTPPRHGPDIEWTRANLAEVLPEQVSPQALYSFELMLNAAQRRFMGRLLSPGLGPIFKVFHGRMYMNLSQMRRVSRLVGSPAADMLRSLGHPEQIRAEDEVAARAPMRELLPLLPDLARIALMDVRARALFDAHERETEMIVNRLRSVRPDTLSDSQLWQTYQWWMTLVPDAMQIVFVMSGVLFRETQIKRACAKVGYPYQKLVYPHLAAGERSISSQQAIDLVRLAAVARRDRNVAHYLLGDDGSFREFPTILAGTPFAADFAQFLERYGHRGRYESDWALPRLHEDPRPALFAIREQLKGAAQDIEALTDRQEADAARAWREFTSKMSWLQRLTLLPRVWAMLRRLKQQYVWREKVRSNLTRILRYCREYHLVLAQRFAERGWIDSRDDYFLLRIEEVGAAITDATNADGLRAIVNRRREERRAERHLRLPLHMFESDLPRLIQDSAPAAPAGTASMTGLCVSPGVVEAEVVVMHDPAEFAAMKRGAILVTRATDPSWTPLFTLASGVVVEVGGMLSHASTIAREYGLPALANVKNATTILTTGQRVRLDASGGRLTVI